MNLNNIVDQLNLKKYALTQEKANLSEEEEDVISTYEPEKKLIIYGSLAPNRPNHVKIEHIIGEWHKGTVMGHLENKGWGADLGFGGYTQTNTPNDKPIEAFILFSDNLNENFQSLDRFEGDDYERILAMFELDNGVVGIGNIYALKN